MWLPLHFVTIPLGYLAVGIGAYFTRRFSSETRQRYVKGVMIFLFCCEFIKQMTVLHAYSPNYLPFHYSSTYYLTFGLFAFGRGRIRHFGACASYIGGALLLVTMTTNPMSVVGNPEVMFSSFYLTYSYIYHMAVIHLWLVMLMNREYVHRRFDFLRYAAFLALWASVAIPAALLLKWNYAGITKSFIPILEKLRLAAGQAAYLAVYFLFILLSAAVAFGIWMLVDRFLKKKNGGSSASPEVPASNG